MQWLFVSFLIVLEAKNIYSFDTINLADVECGTDVNSVKNLIEGKVILGTNETENGKRFPWMVSIKYPSRKNQTVMRHSCGGTLISKRWILSAAHCFPMNTTNYKKEKSKYTFGIGKFDLRSREGGESMDHIYKAEQIINHPYFAGINAIDKGNDIALVYLDKDVEWSHSVKPICLAADEQLSFAGAIGTVAGWGMTNERKMDDKGTNMTMSPVLKNVEVPIIYNRQCQQWFEEEYNETVHVPDTVMCAGLKQGGRDTCQGDSGGPLMVKHWTGRYVEAGIVSWGIGCALPKLPGIYTRVASHIDWIVATIAKQQFLEHNQIFFRNYFRYLTLQN